MNRQRLFRVGRWVCVGLLVAPFVLWIGVSIGAKLTVGADVPFGQLAGMVGETMFSGVLCAVVGCEAELPEGMESAVFADDLVQDTTVALDIDERGRVYVAETARQRAGGEDNRSHPYWLMDDLASRTIEDRQAYYEKALAEGRFEDPDHFTRNADRIVRLEDEDGDGVADRRTVVAEWSEMLSGLIAGVEAREGTLWVTSVPSIYRLRDGDEDGTAELREELHRGFGVKTSLAGHDLHGLTWGSDGRLYFSMGDRGYHLELPDGRILEPALGPGRGAIFRMNADGSELEVFATGVRNPQELAFDDHGNLFTGDNNGDGGDRARLVYLVEGGETGWAMPYQSLAGDYLRGPWVAERLWEQQHATQPAWVLPPVGHIGNGPAGLAHYPGLGLPERYADHFFLCDYGYTNGRSGIWSFGVEPKGASFEMVDLHHFAWSILATDFDFDWNGQMFASVFDQISLTQHVERFWHPESRESPRVAELRGHVSEGRIRDKSTPTLVDLLRFPDQRLRLRAQFELAARGEVSELVRLARDSSEDLVPRLHALWGLGQQGPGALQKLASRGAGWLAGQPDELRAQWMRVVGDAGVMEGRRSLEEALDDPAPRVRFFAAQSLGKIGDSRSVSPLFSMLRENADEDVYLRHAAVYALHRIGDLDPVWARARDESRSIRLAALLVLRLAGDDRVSVFLEDPDALISVEAARAIYDLPIEGAMPALAALIARVDSVADDDLQTGHALHRRVIGANVRLRSEQGARALARYAADESQSIPLREMALEALAEYVVPPPRDLTMGFYRPLPAAPPELLANVFRTEGRRLVESSLGPRALEIASEIGAVPLSGEELIDLASDPNQSVSSRLSALRSMRLLAAAGGDEYRGAAHRGLESDEPALREASRDLLMEVDADAGILEMLAATSGDGSISERQHAFRSLGEIHDPRVHERLRIALDDWLAGELEAAVALDALEAAAQHSEDAELASLATELLMPRSEAVVDDRLWALDGGNVESGRRVFQTHGDCQRCHGADKGHGAGVGPPLGGISRRGARHVLESILVPQADIASGFGQVVVTTVDDGVAGLLLEETETAVTIDVGGGSSQSADLRVIPRAGILSISDPVTGMPPIGLGLGPSDLRDVVAYVMSLE